MSIVTRPVMAGRFPVRPPDVPSAPPGFSHPRFPLPAATWLSALLAAGMLAVAAPAGADADADRRVPPPWKGLSTEEARLWEEQGIDRGATHLAPQSEARRAGGTTILNVVVVLVDFPDYPADRETHDRAYYEELLFSRNTHPTGSVADFLNRSSFGRLELRGRVYGWHTTSKTRPFYTANNGGLGYYPLNSQRLAEEAILLADPSLNYAHYDNEGPDAVPDSGDDDELVDGIIVIHAGTGREGGSSSPSEFVSIQWRTREDVPVDGVFGREFTLNPEDGTVGIYLHELGHLLGLPDLYPTDRSIQGVSFGLGAWSLMAGGLLLGEGVYPVDFDAWSKAKLGFVDVDRLFLNRDDFVMPPVQTSGKVYRLWANGLGDKEYFLVENRQQAGLDAYLPGGGLLIYHVDERVPTNNNPDLFHVALEQADGLYELENRYGSASFGDPGDPYRTGNVFGPYTDPDSRANNGEESSVAVFDIRGPDAAGVMQADLHVIPSSRVTLVDVSVREIEGDGDGLLESGETAGVLPRVKVDRVVAQDLRLSFSARDAYAEVLDSVLTLGTVSVGQTVEPASPARVRIGGPVPSDPFGVGVELAIDWRGDMGRRTTLHLGVGAMTGRFDDFNALDHGWAHARLRPSAKDQWIYSATLGAGGSPGFKCGNPGRGYLAGVDAALESPTILLPAGAELVFKQSVDLPVDAGAPVTAGGLIEISVNGGDWQMVTPDGGYSRVYSGSVESLRGKRVYAGRLAEGTFHPQRVNLATYTGSVRVRFRFVSDYTLTLGEGWHLDDVEVRSASTPVRLVGRTAVVDGADVVLAWTLAEPLPLLVRWKRGARFDEAVVVGEGWIDAAEAGEIRDPGAASALPEAYWLESLERDGSSERWGPWIVERAPVPFTLALEANPVRGGAVLTWSGAAPTGASIRVHDVRGRLVLDAPLPAGAGSWTWSGRDAAGRDVPAGIYFARVTGAPGASVRIVRLP